MKAHSSLPHNAQNGQTADSLSSAYSIHQRTIQLNTELEEAETRLVYFAEMRRLIMEELSELVIMKQDAQNSDELRRNGAGAVAEAERLVGGGL